VLTNEHVNPRWLLQHLQLPADDKLLQGVADVLTGELVAPPRIHSTFAFVQGRVCESCNSGWMSRLETAAQPLLISLIEERRSIPSLEEREAALVGKWAAKTAYLHTWASPLKWPVQLAHVQQLTGDAGMPSPGVGVFAMQADYRKPSGYYQSGTWLHIGGDASTARTSDTAYKVGLQYRKLYLLVAFWPDAAAEFVRHDALHSRLVPRVVPAETLYSRELAIGGGPIDRLAAFTDALAVMHRS
jgi:hypothetical protein